jgi:sugar-specific transcriptional regulator TrmB
MLYIAYTTNSKIYNPKNVLLNMNTETLISLGLSKREAEVYYALLQVDDALASKISEKTKEARTNTYDTLKSLIKKGLVSYVIKENRKYFMATDPKKLLEWMDTKKEEVERERKLVENLIPDLKKLRLPKEKKVVVEVFEGKEGFRIALNRTIEDAKKGDNEILMLNALANILKTIDPIYQAKYYLMKKQEKIRTKYIFNGRVDMPKSPNAEYKFLNFPQNNLAATSIHGDSVIFWLITEPLIAIIVQSKELADSYRNNFNELWKIAKN